MSKARAFVTEAEAFLARLNHDALYAFARTCTEALEQILQKGFDAVNEGFNPDEGTQPINLIREKLFPVFEDKLERSKAAYRAGVSAARETVAAGAEEAED